MRTKALSGKILTLSILILPMLFITGCTGMADASYKLAGLGVITEDESTFDGAKIIEVSPNWLYDPKGSFGNSVKLGARWSSKASEHIGLILSYSADTSGYGKTYLSLTGLDINIDGKIHSFTTHRPTNLSHDAYNSVSRTIYTQSSNIVVIPFDTFESMLSAKDCRLRIHTNSGYEDAQFSIERMPGGGGTAILSMREFLDKIYFLASEKKLKQ